MSMFELPQGLIWSLQSCWSFYR